MPSSLFIIGGSGFVSGSLAREALAQGWNVTALTRGKRPLPAGVRDIVADRKDAAAFRKAVASAGDHFDLVVDGIAYEPADARQVAEAFGRGRAGQVVMISTDFVYSPHERKFPQSELDAKYVQEENYGGNKRRCELELAQSDLAWTVLRPCHIYGPGSLLGCSPPANRDEKIIARLRAGETIPLVGGRLLQQPIFARDLAKLALSVKGNARAHRQIFNAAGPDMIESRRYYEIIAETLGVPLKCEDQPLETYLKANPDKAPFLCHRIYDLTRMQAAGLAVPSTPIEAGLREHVQSLLT